MANDNQTNLEYIVIKAFLYKYTPDFIPVTDPVVPPNTPQLESFSAWETTLDDTKFFTKYDISRFVVSYSFEQNIDETTYSWSLELQDLASSFSLIDSSLKVPAPPGGNTTGLSFSSDTTNAFDRLATYETNADTAIGVSFNAALDEEVLGTKANDPVENIIVAKKNRGLGYPQLTVQNPNLNGVLPQIPGLKLSDLIQEYDFIAVYIYKNTTPITDVTGIFFPNNTKNGLTNNPLPYFVQTDDTSLASSFNPLGNGVSPEDPHLRYETVLSSPMLNGQPFFSNEINGFVMKKIPVRAINQVDRVVVSGNGWSRLLGCNKRLMKPSYLTGALYQLGELLDMKTLSGFQTVYAGKSIAAIIQDLFDLVFRIDFQTSSVSDGVPVLNNSFSNISSLIVGNTYPANLFNIPSYLLACVMKRQGFNYMEPLDIVNFAGDAPGQIQAEVLSTGTGIVPSVFQSTLATIPGQVGTTTSNRPVIIDQSVQNLKAYFIFLAAVFTSKFSPELKTPYEILEEIRKNTFVEIFESSSGTFYIRSPQYNNTVIYDPNIAFSAYDPANPQKVNSPDVSMVLSSNLNIISNTYSETTDNLITKVFTNFSVNGLPVVPGLEQFAYCDGKLLDQFGLFEANTVANPNINLKKNPNNNVNNSKINGLFEYCRYFLRIINARLKTMTVVCDFDPSVKVGYTFLDVTNSRFGYINAISKQIIVAGTATMTLSITYVRDANINLSASNPLSTLMVEQLPILADLEEAFSNTSANTAATITGS